MKLAVLLISLALGSVAMAIPKKGKGVAKDKVGEVCSGYLSRSIPDPGFGFGFSDKFTREREEREAAQRQQRSAELLAELRSNSSTHLTDIMNAFRLSEALSGYSSPQTVAILIGDRSTEPRETQIEHARHLTEFSIEHGYNVIFEAESQLAPVIAELAGSSGLAISSGEAASQFKNVITIRNPYLRLRAFSLAKKVGISDGSAVGMGLAINNSATHHFSLKLGSKFGFSFSKWEPDWSEENFGVRLDRVEWFSLLQNDHKPLKLLNDEELVESLSLTELKEVIEFAKTMDKAVRLLTEHQPAPGAVVFGSGRYPGKHASKISDIVSYLGGQGIPIVTGGAGGVMEIANRAAFEAGTDSIGIGLGGRLESEKKTMSSLHTLTLSVSDYQERIPLLLNDRKLVLIAPGGMGTMKEVATTLVSEAGKTKWDTAIIFVGVSYYKNMYEGLLKALPTDLATHVHLVDSREDMETVLEYYKTEVWDQETLNKVFRAERPIPRDLPKPKYFEKSFTAKTEEEKATEKDKKTDGSLWPFKPFSWWD